MELLPNLKIDRNRRRVKQCPCGKDNKDGKFSPFEGYEDKGRCHSCGETFLPEIPKQEQRNNTQAHQYKKAPMKPKPKNDYIPKSTFQKQLTNGKHLYGQNNFIKWLGNEKRGKCTFDTNTIKTLIEKYFLCNSGMKKYEGWVLFPYIDINGRVRNIKAMDYNPDTGKRIKEPYNKCYYIGKEILDNKDAKLDQCFYGEHQLKGNNKPAKIFESEATATYAAPFYPKCVCLATGGIHGCKWTDKDKCKVLEGRHVVLYPDIDAHDDWEEKAEILRGYGIDVKVSQLIKNKALKYAEQHSIDYAELVKLKLDLRDFLQHIVLQNINETQKEPITITIPVNAAEKFSPPILTLVDGLNVNQVDYVDNYTLPERPVLYKISTENWNDDIDELEEFLKSVTLPSQPLLLNTFTTISDINLFIENHLACIKANNGKRTFLPDLNRLKELKNNLNLKPVHTKFTQGNST